MNRKRQRGNMKTAPMFYSFVKLQQLFNQTAKTLQHISNEHPWGCSTMNKPLKV